MDDDRCAALAVACLVEPGTAGIAEAVAEHGPQMALEQVLGRLTRRSSSMPGRWMPDEIPELVDRMATAGVRVVLPGDLEYPSQLADLAEPPMALWVRGPLDLRLSALRSVAVVGSRACTPYGERATAALCTGLAQTGWSIVSGAAYGIDAAAHRATLAVDGPTIAVLACGPDRAYPRAHDALLGRIGDTGLVVSELPPGSEPLRFRFLARNRVIAALARGTVVVEASRRSGAIATANRAMDLGRAVMAVPGPVTSMASGGSNRLIHEQAARAVCDASEVASVILGAPDGEQLELPDLALPEGAQAVLAALSERTARGLAEIVRRCGAPDAECLAQLGLLEISGHASRTAAGWRRFG